MTKRRSNLNFTTRLGQAVLGFCLTVASSYLQAEGDSAYVTVNGNQLHYEAQGSGDVVLFVHGAISDRRVWDRYQESIAKTRQFVAFDQRYFGESIPTDKTAVFSADEHASDLVKFIEALEVGPLSVVSWSYGGDVVARAAIQRPDLFKAMIFYEPDINGLIADIPGATRATNKLFENVGPAISAVEKGDNQTAALHFIDLVFMMPSGSAANEPESFKSIWLENADTLPPYMEAPAGNVVSCEKLGQLRQPTMIVSGADGYVYDSMMVERAVHCMPNAIQATLQGVTHDGPHRKPEELAKMINSFLGLVVE